MRLAITSIYFIAPAIKQYPSARNSRGVFIDRNVSHRTKEAIIVLLAHMPVKSALAILRRYNNNPDKELEIFAKIALDECEMWNG